jgi:uncharacterized membrane protein
MERELKIVVSDEVYVRLSDIASRNRCSVIDVARRAIPMMIWFDEVKQNNAEIVVYRGEKATTVEFF